jgi:hypothetical protein
VHVCIIAWQELLVSIVSLSQGKTKNPQDSETAVDDAEDHQKPGFSQEAPARAEKAYAMHL